MRVSGMARPGLEPGTPRFSVVTSKRPAGAKSLETARFQQNRCSARMFGICGLFSAILGLTSVARGGLAKFYSPLASLLELSYQWNESICQERLVAEQVRKKSGAPPPVFPTFEDKIAQKLAQANVELRRQITAIIEANLHYVESAELSDAAIDYLTTPHQRLEATGRRSGRQAGQWDGRPWRQPDRDRSSTDWSPRSLRRKGASFGRYRRVAVAQLLTVRDTGAQTAVYAGTATAPASSPASRATQRRRSSAARDGRRAPTPSALAGRSDDPLARSGRLPSRLPHGPPETDPTQYRRPPLARPLLRPRDPARGLRGPFGPKAS